VVDYVVLSPSGAVLGRVRPGPDLHWRSRFVIDAVTTPVALSRLFDHLDREIISPFRPGAKHWVRPEVEGWQTLFGANVLLKRI
jgi:hypothetical protein